VCFAKIRMVDLSWRIDESARLLTRRSWSASPRVVQAAGQLAVATRQPWHPVVRRPTTPVPRSQSGLRMGGLPTARPGISLRGPGLAYTSESFDGQFIVVLQRPDKCLNVFFSLFWVANTQLILWTKQVVFCK